MSDNRREPLCRTHEYPLIFCFRCGEELRAEAAREARAVSRKADAPPLNRDRERVFRLTEIVRALLAEPYGCSLCDSRKPRNQAKGHQPNCAYEAAQLALEEPLPRRRPDEAACPCGLFESNTIHRHVPGCPGFVVPCPSCGENLLEPGNTCLRCQEYKDALAGQGSRPPEPPLVVIERDGSANWLPRSPGRAEVTEPPLRDRWVEIDEVLPEYPDPRTVKP